RLMRRCLNVTHSALASTAFSADLLPFIEQLALRGNPYIDLALWEEYRGEKLLLKNWHNNRPLHVGIKGLPGEPGISEQTHKGMTGSYDVNYSVLRDWLREDAEVYMRLAQ